MIQGFCGIYRARFTSPSWFILISISILPLTEPNPPNSESSWILFITHKIHLNKPEKAFLTHAVCEVSYIMKANHPVSNYEAGPYPVLKLPTAGDELHKRWEIVPSQGNNVHLPASNLKTDKHVNDVLLTYFQDYTEKTFRFGHWMIHRVFRF